MTSAFKHLKAKNHVSHNGPSAVANKGEVEKEGGSSGLFSHPALDESEYRGKSGEERSYSLNFSTFEHKDAYLVLRSLCKLSMKATVGGGTFDSIIVMWNDEPT